MGNSNLAGWVLAAHLARSPPDYTQYGIGRGTAAPPVVRGPRIAGSGSLQDVFSFPSRVVAVTPREALQLAVESFTSQASKSTQTFKPNFADFDRLVRGSFETSEARNNAYYHIPAIVDLNKGPVNVVDNSSIVLAPNFRENWTALDLPEARLTEPRRRLVTMSGLPAEEELDRMAPTVDEIRYLLRQKDPQLRELVRVLEYVVVRFDEEKYLIDKLAKRLDRSTTIIEDIRGNVIWDVVKTVGALVLRAIGVPGV